MIRYWYMILLVFSILQLTCKTLHSEEGTLVVMDKYEYLYARHDDERLVKLACSEAILGNSKAAFYLGLVLSEPQSLFYKPKDGYMWLQIAHSWDYPMAKSYLEIGFPHISERERIEGEKNAKKCILSGFKECLADKVLGPTKPLGWPRQSVFRCNK